MWGLTALSKLLTTCGWTEKWCDSMNLHSCKHTGEWLVLCTKTTKKTLATRKMVSLHHHEEIKNCILSDEHSVEVGGVLCIFLPLGGLKIRQWPSWKCCGHFVSILMIDQNNVTFQQYSVFCNINFWRFLICRAYWIMNQRKNGIFIYYCFLSSLWCKECIAQNKKKACLEISFLPYSLALFELFSTSLDMLWAGVSVAKFWDVATNDISNFQLSN